MMLNKITFIDPETDKTFQIYHDELVKAISGIVFQFINHYGEEPTVVLIGRDALWQLRETYWRLGFNLDVQVVYNREGYNTGLQRTRFADIKIVYIPWMEGILPLTEDAFTEVMQAKLSPL